MPTLDGQSVSSCGDDVSVEVDVFLAGFYSLEQDLHEPNPLFHFTSLRLPLVKRTDHPIASVFPGFVDLEPLSECKCLTAPTANEQPAASAPRAVHLARGRD